MSKTQRFICTALLLGAIVLIGGLMFSSSTAAAMPEKDFTFALDETAAQDIVARVYFNSRAELDAVSGQLDIWEVHHDEGYFVAMMSPVQRDQLTALGYQVEVDQERTAAITAALDGRYYYFDPNFTNPNNYYMVNFLEGVNSAYPNITELIDIGNAWQGEHMGYHRDILVLRITNEDPTYGAIEDKPPFFLLANVHAREVTTPEMAIRYIKYLTDGYNGLGGYNVDPDVTWLVDHHAVYILVSANPDGHRVNEADINAYRRKNMDNDDGCNDPDYWGVDLNRNHSFKWGCCGGSSGSAWSNTYRGPGRASEPETEAIQNYFATIFTDYNGPNGDDEVPPAAPDDAMGIFISLHTYSDLVLWPWGWSSTTTPNGAQLTTIGRKFAYFNNYQPQQAHQLYTVDGSTDDWTYGKFGVASFTFEIGPAYGICGDFFPSYDCQDGINGAPQNFWAENRPAFIYAHKIARTPYITAYGPDTQNLGASPAIVDAGDSFTLTANVMDHRYGGDPLSSINAAEYFIDAPGADGTGTAMSPVDGSWGGTSENVEATVVTDLGLAPVQHYILVHGRNTQGKWGPFTAIFFEIAFYQPGTDQTSQMSAADPDEQVVYTVQLENQGNITDTFDIQADALWPLAYPAEIGPLAAGETTDLFITVTVPITAAAGASDLATITITSQGDPTKQADVTLTTSANTVYGLAAVTTVDAQPSPGWGVPVTYTLMVTNTGNITDSFGITVTSAWQVQDAPSIAGPLAPGEGMPVSIVIHTPVGALSGQTDAALVIFTSQGNPARQMQVTLTTTAQWYSNYLPMSIRNGDNE